MSLFSVSAAQAHSFVTDGTNTGGAIIHIAPDDDPIAGETSSIFVDISGELGSPDSHYFSMKVVDTTGFSNFLPTEVSGNLVTGYYNFPFVGTYTISLTAISHETGDKVIFTLEQEVTRSPGDSSQSIQEIWPIAIIAVTVLVGFLYTIRGFSQKLLVRGSQSSK